MSQNSSQGNTLTVPTGWEPPKYQLGQVVNVCRYFSDHCDGEPVIVVGFAYRSLCTHPEAVKVGMGWEYTVMLSPDSPTWFVEDEMVIVSEEDISLPSMSALEAVNKPLVGAC
jgi:hypothetical protein